MMAEGFETAAVASRGGELGGDQHLAAERFAQGLDARDLIDRRPDHREVEAVDSADIAIEDFPDMECEVDRGSRLARLAPGAIEPVESVHRLHRGIDRAAAGRLPGRVRERERREHAVAHEFQYLPATRAQ